MNSELIPDAAEAEAETETRKALIWEDCPACAYKHLTAAYAAVTTPEFPIRAEVYVHPSELLMARAVIAIREFRTGYRGNLALAAGCLALAENCFGITPEELNEFRCARMHLTTGECGGTCAGAEDAENALREPSLAAFAGAHICEALRELPELADRTYAGAFFDSGAFSPDSVKDLQNWLRENIKWVADTYELFPNQEEKSDEPERE
jgi:hypothetical protein